MAEETTPPPSSPKPETPTPSRTEKQAPSDRQSSGERPTSRPPDENRPRKGKGDGEGGDGEGGGGEGKGPKKNKSGAPWLWVFLALSAVIVIFTVYRCTKKDPLPNPPAKLTVNKNDDAFYKAFISSLESLSRAKIAFRQGLKLMQGVPESLPETATTETLPQSPIFQAATQFSLSLENFKYANNLVNEDHGGPLKSDLDNCRTQYLEALEKYQSTASLYNSHAKAKYEEENDKLEKFALSDANARWELAERLMNDFLVKGCDGGVFRYLKQQPPEVRATALAEYQSILGSDYNTHRVSLEGQLGVPAGPVSSPIPSVVPVPTP